MSELVVKWSVALVPLLLALLFAIRPLRGLWLARRRQRLISSCGVKRLDNVIVDDGIGGHEVLEHVLLTANGLMLLLPRQCRGSLFGGDTIDRWTLMSGGKSFHFENPLHHLDEMLAAVRYLLPGIPVEGWLLLSGECTFPKGRPGRILLLEELAEKQVGVGQAVLPVLEEAWQTLQKLPQAEGGMPDRTYAVSPARWWWTGLLLSAALGWMGFSLNCLQGVSGFTC